MKNKKIAVTGATGLVGSHLVAELVRRGCRDITLPVRDAGRVDRMTATLDREGTDYSQTGFNVVETELVNPMELREALQGVEVVFNCAAAVSLGAMDEEVLVDGNMQIARHVVNACIAAGVDKLVHVSSIATLGKPPEGAGCVDETMTPGSLAGMDAYGTGKLLAEHEVMRGAAGGLKTVVVNPAVIFGAGDWKSGSTAMIPVLAAGLPFYTKGMTAMVDVRDVARAMAELAECPDAVGERYILAGANISYRELLTTAAAAAKQKPPRYKAGRLLLGAAWRGVWIWGRISGSRPLFTKELARILQDSTCYSTDKIKAATGFGFTPIDRTIERVVKQYIAEKDG